jgi:hypothetical protein
MLSRMEVPRTCCPPPPGAETRMARIETDDANGKTERIGEERIALECAVVRRFGSRP